MMKKMNIVYPPLVEQAYQMMKKLNKNVSKQEIYKKLIETNMIDQQGNPTKWALDNGLVSEFNTIEEARNKLNQISPQKIEDQVDADINNVFSRVPVSAFRWKNEHDGYAIDSAELKKAILSALKDGSLSPIGRKHWLEVLADINSQEN
ncbi:hypothetical protein L2821_03245 [Lactobacillus gasseri]|jgi:hypothetical protein|nr:hypothetical protein [Lactobacillus gasseri]MCZ3554059.1 hypothetical protein [Lactobacillus gasseri]MCZ3581992.1 hypothetical protein [Lactobacillus gasseri]MCZ3583785.1 hypothetical protein [Lactobacillus gasseri]MCZ3585568.1 hypothetical protein [Lactobacillus gasseri]